MKKTLLFLGLTVGLISFKASAQLALEDFNAGPVLPAGWVLINDGHTVSTSYTGSTAIQDSLDLHAWWPAVANGGTTDYQMITTSLFTPSATADRWLITPSFNVTSPNMAIQWDDYDLNSGESIGLRVSPTAGTTTSSFTNGLYSAKAGVGGMTTHQVPIGAWNGTTIRISFRDSITNNWGLLVDNVKTVILPSLDLAVTTVYMAPFVQTGSSNPIAGIIHNNGIVTTTSMNLNYSVNGGAAVPTALTGLSIPLATNYTFTSGTPWVPATAGTYTIKVWADNINGTGVDEVHSNDTVTLTVLVIDALQPKTVMIEEFTQASCDPCANAAPNVDSVYANNLLNAILLRYHVNFPGRDCMDTVTLAPFVSTRLSNYNVKGVPDAQVDGQYVYPGAGSFTTPKILSFAALKSPFTITVTPTFNAATQTYSVSATIKSFGDIPAGLKVRAALAVDTLTYAKNQSTESLPQTVFPQVAEAMFGGAGGTVLTAFTTSSTQTFNSTWVKNHPWGSSRSVWSYDSSATGTVIVWVEDDSRNYVYQAAWAKVNTVKTTGSGAGVHAVTGNNGSMEVYPNPASNNTTISLNLTTGGEVKMEVYNMLGQVVYNTPAEHRNSGTSLSAIDLSNFASGEYIVKVSINGEVLNKQFTVAK